MLCPENAKYILKLNFSGIFYSIHKWFFFLPLALTVGGFPCDPTNKRVFLVYSKIYSKTLVHVVLLRIGGGGTVIS